MRKGARPCRQAPEIQAKWQIRSEQSSLSSALSRFLLACRRPSGFGYAQAPLFPYKPLSLPAVLPLAVVLVLFLSALRFPESSSFIFPGDHPPPQRLVTMALPGGDVFRAETWSLYAVGMLVIGLRL